VEEPGLHDTESLGLLLFQDRKQHKVKTHKLRRGRKAGHGGKERRDFRDLQQSVENMTHGRRRREGKS